MGEAWVRAYYLDKTAKLQMDLLKSGAKINMPNAEVSAGVGGGELVGW